MSATRSGSSTILLHRWFPSSKLPGLLVEAVLPLLAILLHALLALIGVGLSLAALGMLLLGTMLLMVRR